MSFSKAKLKRFNEVSDSPYSERFERKDSIRRFFREQFQNDKKPKEVPVVAVSVTAVQSDTESVKSNTESTKSKSGYRLFRTPSLPRRLRFNRHNSDLTPKKSKNAHAAASAAIAATTTLSAKSPPITKEKTDKDELDAAKVELINKTEVLLEYEQLIDELKQKTHLLSQLNDEHTDAHNAKDVRIRELEKEVFDSHMANEMLEAISEKAITKINVLEGEIRMILRNHDNEIEFLIRTNAELEMRYEQMAAQERSSNVKHELAAIKIELNDYKSKFEACEQMLQEERAKMLEKDNECNKLLDENLSLVEQLDALKKQADDDMLTYALETHKLSSDLEIEKREKTKIITELCLKEEFLMEIQRELAAKEAEMDAERDELKASYNAEVETVSKKFDQHVSNLKEVHEMQLKEAESIYAAEMAKLSLDHNAAMIKLKEISQKEIDRINDMAEEKIRISEIQAEQKLKGLEVALEQTIQKEKESWKIEIEKCQKIAENEIMQCEFEKQDLKTLLQSANDLMHQKDDKIEELEQRLQKESDTVTRGNGMLESELKKCQRELYNYHLTLNNTRATVNILMERLRKSDKDVEVLQMELDSMLEVKASMETQNLELSEEANNLRNEVNEYRNALSALRNSSLVLERQIVEKESAFEKLLSSEEETLETVNKMGQLFNEKLEQNIDKYAELYNDLKRKYDARETYIKDMKALLEEFATGIELARFELDLKEKQIFELLEENKNIKLETMTYKFKCEQFEKYDFEQRVPNPSPDFTLEEDNGKVSTTDDAMVSNQLIENIINQLEKEANNQTPSNVHNTELYSDEDKITAENMQLREKVSEQMKQIEILKEMADMESCHAKENLELKSKLQEMEQNLDAVKQFANETADKYHALSDYQQNMQQLDTLKEKDKRMKNKIAQLQKTIKEHETTISELKENTVRTPLKMNHNNLHGTPKTPKTPTLCLPGKENLSPIVLSPATGLIRSRLN